MQKSVSPDINIGFHRIIIVPLLSISMIMKLSNKYLKPPKRVATTHRQCTPPSQCVNSSNSHQIKGNLHSANVEFR